MKANQKSALEIAAKIRAKKRFELADAREQKMALTGAKYLGIEITTESNGNGGFIVKFIK